MAVSDDKDQIYVPEESSEETAESSQSAPSQVELIPDDIQHNSEVSMAERAPKDDNENNP